MFLRLLLTVSRLKEALVKVFGSGVALVNVGVHAWFPGTNEALLVALLRTDEKVNREPGCYVLVIIWSTYLNYNLSSIWLRYCLSLNNHNLVFFFSSKIFYFLFWSNALLLELTKYSILVGEKKLWVLFDTWRFRSKVEKLIAS